MPINLLELVQAVGLITNELKKNDPVVINSVKLIIGKVEDIMIHVSSTDEKLAGILARFIDYVREEVLK